MRAFIVLAVVVAASSAHAGGVVLEAYTGDRPADAARLVSPILDELAARKFETGDTVGRSYEAAVSRPALTAAGLPGDFSAQVDAGFKAWVGGRFDDAIKVLAPLVEAAHANTAAFAQVQTLREPLEKAMIGLALAQMRTGDPAATRATFAEILAGFPDAQLSRALYGAEAVDLFEQVRRDVNAAGRGRLIVEADDGAVVFVDELYRAVGSTTIELPPGDYRVCVLLDKKPSRSHLAKVRAKQDTHVALDARADRAMHTSGWTGFAFATAADREAHESAYAAQAANALGATAVAVVGIDQVRGRPAIVGSLVSLQTGREIRRASVALEPDPSTDRLRALARYLAGEDPAAGVEVQPLAAPSVTAGAGGHVEGVARWGGWQWITAGAAVGALAAGGYLLSQDGKCSVSHPMGTACPNVYANSPTDYVLLGAGVGLAAVSVYLFATGGGHAAQKAAYVVPTRGGAAVGFSASW